MSSEVVGAPCKEKGWKCQANCKISANHLWHCIMHWYYYR